MTFLRTIAISLLTLLFVAATTGVSVVQHYCGGELDGVSLFAGSTCGCTGDDMPKDCCADVVTFCKLDTDALAGLSITIPVSVEHLVPPAPLVGTIACTGPVTDVGAWADVVSPPPRTDDIPVFTCSLLI